MPVSGCMHPLRRLTSNQVRSKKLMGNTFKTAFLLTALTLLLMFIGRAFGGRNGMLLALAFAAVMNFGLLLFLGQDRAPCTGAAGDARAVAASLCAAGGAADAEDRTKRSLPMPKIYVIPTESPNAFATGRNPKHAWWR